MSHKSKILLSILPQFLCLISTLIIFSFVYYTLHPEVSGTYSQSNKIGKFAFSDSLEFSGNNSIIEVDANLELGALASGNLIIIPDDCLIELQVNNQQIARESLPLCNYKTGHQFDLNSYLKPGNNSIKARIKNKGGKGGLRFKINPWESTALLLIVCSTGLVVLCILSAICRLGLAGSPLAYIFLFGTFIRFIYFLNTEYRERGYDVQGHVEYLFYVLNHFSIPPAQAGWQFYHPPLYYFLTGAVLLPFKAAGIRDVFLIEIAQFTAFIISAVALAIGLWVGRELLKTTKNRLTLPAFGLFLSVFPGLVYFSSRISNDSFLIPLSFLFFGLLLKWFNSRRSCYWYGTILVLGLCLITKSNSIAYIAIAFSSFLLAERKDINTKAFWQTLYKSVIILFLLSAWLYIFRFGFDQQKHIVGNLSRNAAGLYTKINWGSYFFYNPFSVFNFPYNSPWTDSFGRNHLFEHLTKSAFTGEWNFGAKVNGIVRWIHCLNFFFLPLAIVAMLRDSIKLQNIPVWLTVVFQILSIIGIMLISPVGNFQEFRYQTILVLPVTFYVLQAISQLPSALRVAGQILSGIFIILCLLCLTALIFPNWLPL